MDWLLEVPRAVANAVSGTSFHDSPQLKACGSKQRSQRWWPMVDLRWKLEKNGKITKKANVKS